MYISEEENSSEGETVKVFSIPTKETFCCAMLAARTSISQRMVVAARAASFATSIFASAAATVTTTTSYRSSTATHMLTLAQLPSLDAIAADNGSITRKMATRAVLSASMTYAATASQSHRQREHSARPRHTLNLATLA